MGLGRGLLRGLGTMRWRVQGEIRGVWGSDIGKVNKYLASTSYEVWLSIRFFGNGTLHVGEWPLFRLVFRCSVLECLSGI